MMKQWQAMGKNQAGFVGGLTLMFAILCLIGLLNHEMWRDEMQTWALARSSTSLVNLFQNLKYETGHSFLWHLCLFGLSRLTRSPIAMQLFHWSTAIAVVYILARYAPFTRVQKTLIVFGYFPLYEYAIISRDYSISLLCMIAFCALFPLRHKHYLPLAALLFLLANTNSSSLIMSGILGLTLVVDFIAQKLRLAWLRDRTATVKVSPLEIMVSLLLWLGGLAIGLKIMLPPADGGVVLDGPQGWDLGRFVATLAIAWKTYFPIPGLSLHFWNTNILDDGYASVLSLLFLPFAIALFIRKPIVLFLYSLGSLTIFWMVYSRFLGVMRHWGYLFLLFLVCLWLSSYYADEIAGWNRWFVDSKLGRFLIRNGQRFLTTVLCVQLIATLLAFSIDLSNPFSAAKQTAQFIRNQNLQEMLIAADDPFATLSVSGYLDKPLYYIARGNFGTFAIFDNRNQVYSQPQLLQNVSQQLAVQKRPVLLLLNYPLSPTTPIPQEIEVAEIKRFEGAIVKDENFYLYQVQPA